MKLLKAWYPIVFSSYLKEDEPHFTSLFGESLVIFRDKNKNPVCIKNRCPHRSSPFQGGILEKIWNGV